MADLSMPIKFGGLYMSKRFFMILTSLVFVSSLTSVSFTQSGYDTESVDEEGHDTYIAPVSNVDEPDSLRYLASKPVIYFDGYNTYINTRVAYKLSAKDDLENKKLYYKIDGGSEKQYIAPFSFETEGRHTVAYRSSDRMERGGNENTFTVVLDDSAPVAILLSEMPVIKNEDVVYIPTDTVFTIKAYDKYSGVSSIKYAVNGEELQEYERSFKMPEGVNENNIKIVTTDNVAITTDKFILKAKDTSGKDIDVNGTDVRYITDTTPPEITITADKEIYTNDRDMNIVAKNYKYSITAVDEESGVASILYRISGEKDFKNYSQPFMLKNVGLNKIEAKAIDKVGNVSDPVALTVFVDVVPPATIIRPIVDETTTD